MSGLGPTERKMAKMAIKKKEDEEEEEYEEEEYEEEEYEEEEEKEVEEKKEEEEEEEDVLDWNEVEDPEIEDDEEEQDDDDDEEEQDDDDDEEEQDDDGAEDNAEEEQDDEDDAEDEQDDEDDAEEEQDDDDDEEDDIRLGRIEQLWADYENCQDRSAIRSEMLRKALKGSMPKKDQEKAHWMDLELITYAIRTVHGNTAPFSRAYLTCLARALADNNHRNTSKKQNKKDRAVVKALKDATPTNPYKPGPNATIKLRKQVEWMKRNVHLVAAPIMRRLMNLMNNVVIQHNGRNVKLLSVYFRTALSRAKFKEQWCTGAQVKQLEAKMEREWAIKCKRELKNLNKERIKEQRAAIEQIKKKFKRKKQLLLLSYNLKEEDIM